MIQLKSLALLVLFFLSGAFTPKNTRQVKPGGTAQADVVIYGATATGVIAAYTAKQAGKSVLLIEPSGHLGGMTSGGLGYTDIGNKFAITGLSRDFYRKIGQHYGRFEQWIFEPHVAKKYLQQYLDQAGIQVLYHHRIVSARKEKQVISAITLEKSDAPSTSTHKTVTGKMFLDCTYEGDLMARAGVSYTVGREANTLYNETINGVQFMKGHQFPDGIDPYKTPGDPKSGLLWGISPGKLDPDGTGDKKVQAYNYRICLTSDPANRITITKPRNYDAERYTLLARLMQKQPEKQKLNDYLIWSAMPNQKTDINNRGGFSTDMIGANYNYPDGSYKEREQIIGAHEDYTKGLLYFLGNDSRVPAAIREEMRKWGYPKDEYTDTGNWTPQLYVREARRMIGSYVMTQANCEGREVVSDGVGMAAYTMDSHNCQRIVVNGMVKNEGNVEIGGFGPYPISYRSLVPKRAECRNLLVPVCLSASHIAYGSIRMEPVFMVLAQSAALAAAMAIDKGVAVQEIPVEALQEELRNNPLANGAAAELLTDNDQTPNVKIAGTWNTVKRGGYGHGYLVSAPGSQAAQTVRYQPTVKKSGRYSVYLYLPRIQDQATHFPVHISDGKKLHELRVDIKDQAVIGQTSGEWYPLGKFELVAGADAYAEINATGSQGRVVADAVLWVPEP